MVERVFCEVCLKEVPKSEAAMAEARDYVAYFCGLGCYQKWIDQRSPEAPPKPAAPVPGELEIQLGHGRSKGANERLKRVLKQHPQRDEPKVDSVEQDEVPPP
ncbi:MAG: DUF3330 domain-containing protein [Betaproteobacteria bacterium]|nr:MAG: DUF3330 domain-containing protein [Betaproteobacteria bacterium]